ncbi:MAG TPA: hypothetical protein VEX14_05245 [Burkholderiaceae bacterium]|nr:hypothetical protein [Burkholderiaceae bacterium]
MAPPLPIGVVGERDDRAFFVTALFQPERAAWRGVVPPRVRTFVQAVHDAAAAHR